MSENFFHYSNRYTSGAFDMRTVTRWYSDGESYYKKYIIIFNDGSNVFLEPNEFYEFEKKFWELSKG